MALENSINPQFDKQTSGYFKLFVPRLPIPNAIERTMVINIFGTVIPAFNINSNTVDWMGGIVQTPVSEPVFDSWRFRFIVDEKMENWKLFYKWMTFINNNKDQFVRDFPTYCINPVLNVLDNYKNTILSLRFVNAWPMNIGELDLDGNDAERVMKSSVVLAYDRYEENKFDE